MMMKSFYLSNYSNSKRLIPLSSQIFTKDFIVSNAKFFSTRKAWKQKLKDEKPAKPYRKMFRLKDKRPIIQKQRATNSRLEEEALSAGLSWRFVTASLVQNR